MAWLKINKAPLPKSEKRDTPEGLWQKCSSCNEIIFRKDFIANQNVCTRCKHHFAISAADRLHHFLDQGTFVEHDAGMLSTDPLKFTDTKPYGQKLKDTRKNLGLEDALLSGSGKLHGREIQVAAFDFKFMGGSMGCVVGEKITRSFLRAHAHGQAAVIFSASGGARMQEGILSLMQMAKTCAALARLREAGLPMISVMTNPTTGGVAASYAMLGDVNIGEPGALIGFAGPRVIRQTTGQELPEGFQTAEYLLEHGMLDMICHRDTLRDQIANILGILMAGKTGMADKPVTSTPRVVAAHTDTQPLPS